MLGVAQNEMDGLGRPRVGDSTKGLAHPTVGKSGDIVDREEAM